MRGQAELGHKRWSRSAGVLVAALLACGTAQVGCAESSADRIERSADVARLFEPFVRPGEPGCSVAVMQDGEVIHASAYGLADIKAGKPLTPDTVFNVASVSKQFTAFSILLLDARDQLSVDDPLVKHIPELAASAKGVTLRHLIHHTGGLRDYTDLLLLNGRTIADGATQYETVQLLARQQSPNSPPGVEYAYSNTGYVLLATVVQRVSGLSMKQFVERNVFGPLGMANSTIVDRYPAQIPALARGYTPDGDGFKVDESAWEQVGDGQVHTSVKELFRWVENFHTGQVGGQELMARMQETGALASGERLDYAAGLVIGEHNGRPTVGHSGGWAGYSSHFRYFPEQRFAANVFCNRNDAYADRFTAALADLFLDGAAPVVDLSVEAEDEEAPRPTNEWQPANLSDFAGAYWSEEAEARCVVVQRGAQLVLEGCVEGLPMQPAEPGQFYLPDIDASMSFPERSGPANGFSLHTYGLYDLPFVRR